MKETLLVFLGGGVGSVLRFALGKWITALHNQQFPWGTLGVNVIACGLMGLLIGLADEKLSPSGRVFWTVGVCGGFSTFSAFSAEALNLTRSGLHSSTILYLLLSIVLCVGATYFGLLLGESQ